MTSVLEDFHERYAFPGATAAIALPDGTVLTAATGFSDIEAGAAMTPETSMLAAGISPRRCRMGAPQSGTADRVTVG